MCLVPFPISQVPRLCHLLRRGDRRNKQWAAAALCNLSTVHAGKRAIVQAGGVEAAQRVLAKRAPNGRFAFGSTNGLQELLLGMLGNLCDVAAAEGGESSSGRSAPAALLPVITTGAVGAAVQLLSGSEAMAVHEAAMHVLGTVTTAVQVVEEEQTEETEEEERAAGGTAGGDGSRVRRRKGELQDQLRTAMGLTAEDDGGNTQVGTV